jgi:cellobiose-specific phosphotransferase system component IIB
MISKDLDGKHVLLLMPNFFNYSGILIDELEGRGAIVDFIENKQLPFDFVSPRCKFRLLRKLVFTIFDLKWNHIKKQLHNNKSYDYFFCINGFLFDKRIISKLKESNSSIKTILYLWDSTDMFDWEGIENFFDKSFSFDPMDSEKLKIQYITNFYPKDVIKDDFIKNDIFFVGTQHSDRYEVLKKVVENNNVSINNIKLLIKYKNVLHNKFIYHILRKFNNQFSLNYAKNYELIERLRRDPFLIYSPISSDTIIKLMNESRFVLDIQAPNQVGIPHQMMRALSMGKQIITTNSWIKNYDFYNPKQILIIDRNNPVLSKEFLESDFQIDEIHDVIKKSRIDNWIDIIFS